LNCPSCNEPLTEVEVNDVKLWICKTEDKYFDEDGGKPVEINKKWYQALQGEKLKEE
jgi:hypothetical protein